MRKILSARISTLEPEIRNRRPLMPRKYPPTIGTARVLIIGVKTIRIEVTVPKAVRIFNGLMCDCGKGSLWMRLTSGVCWQKSANALDVSRHEIIVPAANRNVMTMPTTRPA